MSRRIEYDRGALIERIEQHQSNHDGLLPGPLEVCGWLDCTQHTAERVLGELHHSGAVTGQWAGRQTAAIERDERDMRTVYEFVQSRLVADGWAPTRREIASQLSGKGLDRAQYLLHCLAAAGYLRLGPYSRQIFIEGTAAHIPTWEENRHGRT